MSDAVNPMVQYFKSIVPTVQDNPAKRRGEEIKTTRMIAEQRARNKHDADQNLRQGGDFGPEDADWQTRHRAIFDSNYVGNWMSYSLRRLCRVMTSSTCSIR
jgi:hypothetical protein